jgi:hypothetical protein
MSIAGVTESLVRLTQACLDGSPANERWSATGLTPRDMIAPGPWRIGWFLWKVEPDSAIRNTTRPLPPGLAAFPVVLHYLLLVRGKQAGDEQAMLGRCMSVVAASPVLAGPQLAPDHVWPDGATLQVTLEQLDTGTLLGIWRSLATPLQLSVAYTVKGLSLPQ